MTVKFVFKGDLSSSDIDRKVFQSDTKHRLSTSNESPQIARHDITVGKSGIGTWIRIDGVEKSQLSQTTINNIVNVVPTKLIRIEKM